MLLSYQMIDTGDREVDIESLDEIRGLFSNADGLVVYADVTNDAGEVVWEWPNEIQ